MCRFYTVFHTATVWEKRSFFLFKISENPNHKVIAKRKAVKYLSKKIILEIVGAITVKLPVLRMFGIL
jgi:hypothetical protein